MRAIINSLSAPLTFAVQRKGIRWESSEALQRSLPRPIHEHKYIPDGMDIDGMENLQESLVFTSTRISDVLQTKYDEMKEKRSPTRLPIVFVKEDNTVFEAIKLMTESKIGAVLVRGEDSEFCGILTERDYMTKVALNGLDSRHTPVGRIMTRNPVTVRTDETCLSGFRKMTKGRFRHVPVTQDGKIVGLLSLGDLVKSILSSFKDSVDYLSDYIAGTGAAAGVGTATTTR